MDDNDEQSWLKHVTTIQAGAAAAGFQGAVCALEPRIEDIARRVCRYRMVSKQIRTDFVDNALSEIVGPRTSEKAASPPRIAQYDPARGDLSGWLWDVLDNCLIGKVRAASRRATHEKYFSDLEYVIDITASAPSPRIHDLSYRRLRNAPFSKPDLEQIASWPKMDRILVLVFLELWHKVPADVWHGWCAGAGLPNPFPPETNAERKRSEWIRAVARSTSATKGRLGMCLTRRLKKLKSRPLDYFKQLWREWHDT